ncbi:MAG: 4-(cytidine 5'-diphospho)-2-C-methyl-D-erythritol kinase [Demequinaceae bacterium]|nr:4-(cytidine 5'-diphospho)-2-C-methyl-D-erythritol kinase [Demequinaceae bacterium]
MSSRPEPRMVGVKAPAKINLQLAVGPKADDGFHPLTTVFQAVSLWETVIASPRDDDKITVTVDAHPTVHIEGIPLDEDNLAVRAAKAVAERFGVPNGIDLRIVKSVPVAGGMAGGSADAAAALVASSEAWGVGATRTELTELAVGLGSDVPFCLHGHTAVGVGRGDVLTPAMTKGELHWVIATQASGLSTASVYEEFDRSIDSGDRLAREHHIDEELMTALRAGDPVGVAERMSNDLQDAALVLAPHLRRVLEAAEDSGALGAIVSGSGPTVLALARSRQHALAVAAGLTASDTADAVLVASGPVSGATVIATDEE